ncbi:hypothetical protein DYB32_007743 [Aphanomyces invadans]|uniref:Uncharacterized protein n=1 Tax=Aphanomyces invadans TaxID=157072 RepID=A0A418AN77_9STRA|nr:hypothetical protein DYB32_007743 [Aphanomyces invadans]
MKFLAGLVHVAVASKVVFDNLKPIDNGAGFFPVFRDDVVATQFRSPPASDDACESEGLTVDRVIFTMVTANVVAGTVLQVGICSSVNGKLLGASQWGSHGGLVGVPNCTKSDLLDTVPIDIIDVRAQLEWSPSSPIVLDPATLYWVAVSSNVDDFSNVPLWLLGDNEYNNDNDPKKDVVYAFTSNPNGPWFPNSDDEIRRVCAMQVLGK